MDLNVLPNRDTPLWSETRWNGCWNPDQGVGLYTHMGRFRKDLDIWWAQTVAYLPDGQLAVDRQWGRCIERGRLALGAFELAQTETGWTSSYDGAGQLTTTPELAAGVQGATAPFASIRWEVQAEPAAPAWDLYGDGLGAQEFAGDAHVQQAFHTRGTLTVNGTEYSLDGVGFKDHSSGVRKWDGFDHHTFTLVLMPGYVFHEIVIYGPGGKAMAPMGAIIRDGQESRLVSAHFTELRDALGGPELSELTIEDASGFTSTLQAELVHALPMTITEENDNINGIDWEAAGDPVILIEGIGRFTDADGNVGYGMHERSRRRSELEQPSLAAAGARS